jgi:hypothetical protein
MISLTLLLAAAPESVDLGEFSTILAEKSKGPVVLIAADQRSYNVDRTESDVSTILDRTKKFGATFFRGEVLSGNIGGIPMSRWGSLAGFVDNLNLAERPLKLIAVNADAVQDGGVSIVTKKGESISIDSILKLKFSKELKLSAYFTSGQGKDFFAGVNVNKVAETDFLRGLAKALGGKYVSSPKVIEIEFDPVLFRKQARELIARAVQGAEKGRLPGLPTFNPEFSYTAGSYQPSVVNNKAGAISALNLLATTIAGMPDNLLEQTFAYPNTTTRLRLNVFQNLQPAVSQFLRSSEPEKAGAQVQNSSRPSTPAGILNRVNPRDPGFIIISSGFRLSLELNEGQNRKVPIQVL